MDNLFDLRNKTALITGSSRGLGFTLAKGLAEAGAKVILNSENPEHLENSRKTMEYSGFDVLAFAFDVNSEEEAGAAIDEIEKTSGPIDILINNAGYQFRGPLENFPVDEWRKILDINLTGAFITARQTARHMIKRQAGKIINICSLQSEFGRKTIAPYAASKGGLKMLTRAMAVEWGSHNIQVNGIGPGYFKTEMTSALWNDEEFDSWVKNRTPAGRWGDTEELIGTMIYLATAASNFVSGQVIFVDGGVSVSM